MNRMADPEGAAAVEQLRTWATTTYAGYGVRVDRARWSETLMVRVTDPKTRHRLTIEDRNLLSVHHLTADKRAAHVRRQVDRWIADGCPARTIGGPAGQ